VCNEGLGVTIWKKYKTKLLEAPKFGMMEFGDVFFVLLLGTPSLDPFYEMGLTLKLNLLYSQF